jgi:hypothetical protein
LYDQSAVQDDPDSGVHDVKPHAFGDLELSIVGPVNLHSGV